MAELQKRKKRPRLKRRLTHHKGVSWETTMDKTVITKINGKCYDFTGFVDEHPGGHDAIRSVNLRDASPVFAHVHGRDKNVQLLIKKYEIKDEGKLSRAEEDIIPLHKADERLMQLQEKYDGKQFISVPWIMGRPAIFCVFGVYLLYSNHYWSREWWYGIASWYYAIFKCTDVSHNLSHNAVFSDAKKNRWYNDYYVILINGLSGRVGWRMHPEHHWTPNVIGMDPALSMPIEWREEAQFTEPGVAEKMCIKNSSFGKGVLLLIGSVFLFAWTTAIQATEGLCEKMRINTSIICLVWIFRTALFIWLLGPGKVEGGTFLGGFYTMIIPYAMALGHVGIVAITQHFDQPIMMQQEFYDAKMSFCELQLRSLQSWYEPPWLVISPDHIYHHFMPTLYHPPIPQRIKDEINTIMKEELGVEIVQRSFLTCFIETWKQYFGFVDPSRIKGYAVVNGVKDPFRPIGMNQAEYER